MFRFDLQPADYGSHAPKTSSAHAAKKEGIKCQGDSDTCACAQHSQASKLESTPAPIFISQSAAGMCLQRCWEPILSAEHLRAAPQERRRLCWVTSAILQSKLDQKIN